MNYVSSILPVATLILSVFLAIGAVKHGKKAKTALVSQLAAFMIACAVTVAISIATSAAIDDSANTTTTSAAGDDINTGKEGLGLLATGLVTSPTGISGGTAVGAAFSAAIGATVEDPKPFGEPLIFVVLGEGITLYGLLTFVLILNKI